MKTYAVIILAIIFGGIGLVNVIQYAPYAIPNILKGLNGQFPIPAILAWILVICFGLMVFASIAYLSFTIFNPSASGEEGT